MREVSETNFVLQKCKANKAVVIFCNVSPSIEAAQLLPASGCFSLLLHIHYMKYQLLNSMHCYSPTPCLWLTPLYEESEWVGQVV